MTEHTTTGRAIARRTTRCGTVLLAACLAGATSADALDLDGDRNRRDDTPSYHDSLRNWDNAKRFGAERVWDRDRKLYQPDGLRSGNYMIFPSIGAMVIYDDNVYGTAKNRVGDFRYEVTPVVRLESHLPRHVLDFTFGGKLTKYQSNDSFDHNDVFGRVDGTLHIDHAHSLSFGLSSALEHKGELEPDDPVNAREKIPVFRNRASIALKRDAGRLYGSIGAAAESWDYGDVRAQDGSMLDQDARDLALFSGVLNMGYRFSPGFELIAKLKGLRQENRGDALLDRDASGYEAMAGLAGELGALFRWRLIGGYGVRDYDQKNIENASSTLVEGRFQWMPTPMISVLGFVGRSIEDTVASDATFGTRTDSKAGLRIEYEMWRNLLITAEGEVRQSEFHGMPREDLQYTGRIGAEYYFNKNWLISIGYEYLERQSNVAEYELARNRVWAGAKLRF